MSSRKQHYVPRFYLKSFESAPRRLHLYNLKRLQAIPHVSVKDQCYRENFDDSDGRNEQILASMENEWARICTSIKQTMTLPAVDSDEEVLLYIFVAFQFLRTAKMADYYGQAFSGVRERIVAAGRRLGNHLTTDDVNDVVGEPENPAMTLLFAARRVCESLLDLKSQLVVSKHREFITTDNPAFRYNQFCQECELGSALGIKKKGLQIFLPISPQLSLFFSMGRPTNGWRAVDPEAGAIFRNQTLTS